MVTPLTDEENQQLQRTIEMFEAITAQQPHDYQSLEILKETYFKLGREKELRQTSLRLANAYEIVGQFSQAILEYEGILQQFPGDLEVAGKLAALQSKSQPLNNLTNPGVPQTGPTSKPRASSTAPSVTSSAGAPLRIPAVPDNLKGDYALAQFLVAERLATQQGLDPLLKRIAAEREPNVAQGLCLSLIDLVVEQQTAKLEDILLAILNKSGKPYLPLSCYDVDRETACLLPREVAFGGGVVPFDQMSRSVLVATSNPFDPVAAEQVQSMLDYNIFWYIAMPADITAALRRAHGYENAKKGGA